MSTACLQLPFVIYFLLVLVLLGTADLQLSHFLAAADQVITASSSYIEALNAINTSEAEGALPEDSGWVSIAIIIYFLFGILWSIESVKNLSLIHI